MKPGKLPIRVHKTISGTLLTICLLLASACDFSGCRAIVDEEQSLFHEWELLREVEYKKWKSEFLAWEERERIWDAKKQDELSKCRLDPRAYYRSSELTQTIKWYGGYEAYVSRLGEESLCDNLTGSKLLDFGLAPKDDSSNFPPAVEKYVLSKRVIVNNPKCFSATDVATAQEEVRRLTDG